MKKILFIVVALGIIAGSAGALVYLKSYPGTSEKSASPAVPTPQTGKLLTWNDPAGFTFKYPEELSVNKHDEDKENYARVELTKSGEPGSITVWVKDPPTLTRGNPATDASGWIASDATLRGATAIDTTLGNQPAKKVFLADQQKTLIGTVSDDALWLIEAAATGNYWQKTLDTIVGSFAIAPASSSASGGEAGGGSDAVDEEEVVQ